MSARGQEEGGRRRAWRAIALVALAFVTCGYGMLRGATVPGWQDTEGFLGHALYVAEHGGLPGFLLWMVQRPVAVILTPSVDSFASFDRYLRERNVRYIVLNTENVYGQGRRLAAALAPYAHVDAEGALIEKQPLPGWRAVKVDPATPRHFIIYESAGVPPEPAGS